MMTDPVLMKDGHTYERSVISECLEKKPTSPVTREPLSMAEGTPNRALKTAIDRFALELFGISVKCPSTAGVVAVEVMTYLKEKIEDLKVKIAAASHIPARVQTLRFGDCVLEDDLETVADCTIAASETDCFAVECQPFQVIVKDAEDRTREMRVQHYQTVLDLKRMIMGHWESPPDQQKLTCQTKVLADGDFIGQLDIAAGATIHLGFTCQPVQVFVRHTNNRRMILRLYPFQSVLGLKRIIEERWGIPPDVLSLICQGRVLTDRDIFQNLNIVPNSTISVSGRLLGGASAQ
jgi:hypothetical protein